MFRLSRIEASCGNLACDKGSCTRGFVFVPCPQLVLFNLFAELIHSIFDTFGAFPAVVSCPSVGGKGLGAQGSSGDLIA